MPETRRPAVQFRYLAGDPSLDLINTVDWTREGLTDERLRDYAGLLSWARGAGLVSSAEARSFRQLGSARPAEAQRVFRESVGLRELLRGVAISVARGKVDQKLLARFNDLVRQTQARRRLVPGPDHRTVGLTWAWEGEEESLAAPLWRVILAASSLLSSAEANRIRVCEGRACGWMYVDRSRNGLRRWCAMDMCGGKEKARRHYARVRAKRAARG